MKLKRIMPAVLVMTMATNLAIPSIFASDRIQRDVEIQFHSSFTEKPTFTGEITGSIVDLSTDKVVQEYKFTPDNNIQRFKLPEGKYRVDFKNTDSGIVVKDNKIEFALPTISNGEPVDILKIQPKINKYYAPPSVTSTWDPNMPHVTQPNPNTNPNPNNPNPNTNPNPNNPNTPTPNPTPNDTIITPNDPSNSIPDLGEDPKPWKPNLEDISVNTNVPSTKVETGLFYDKGKIFIGYNTGIDGTKYNQKNVTSEVVILGLTGLLMSGLVVYKRRKDKESLEV